MSNPKLRILGSLVELLAEGAAWDDLWQRSEVSLPTARAEPLALWIEQFARRTPLRILVVEEDRRLVAALPLVSRRIRNLLGVAALPCSCWSASGELLLDPTCHVPSVTDALVLGLKQLDWPLVWLEPVRLEAMRWHELTLAARRHGMPVVIDEHYRVGQVRIGHDWQAYQAQWSRNHRQNMRKALKRAEQAGRLQLRVETPLEAAGVQALIERGFRIEDSGWKHARGSSVMATEGMFDFFCRQAQSLARPGHLELAFLEHEGRPIAFEYGMAAKGVYYSSKVGYDEQFAGFAPGQLLRLKLIEHFFSQPDRYLVDWCGPLAEATARWCTGHETAGRIVIAPGNIWSRQLGRLFRACRPLKRQAARLLQGTKAPGPSGQADVQPAVTVPAAAR